MRSGIVIDLTSADREGLERISKDRNAAQKFQVTDQPVFAVAGFWQHTKEATGFAMVTCNPNELVAPIHPKAMITILRPEDYDTWLCGSYNENVALQRPFDPATMSVRRPVFPTRV